MGSKNWMLSGMIISVVFVSGCLVTPGPHARSVPLFLAPPLPPVVVFDTEQPYYVQEGYHYHYQNDRWFYSRSHSGPWTILPRDRYPREVRYRDGGHRHDAGPGLQVLIAPPLPSIVLFDTEPYYVQEGYHYHYQNNGWYYSRSRSGPWTSLPRDRYPREVRYRDGRHGDDKGHAPQMIHPSMPDRHQEIQKPEHTFGSDRNHLDSASGSQRKSLSPTVERHERVVTPIPEHRERVQPSKEFHPTVTSPTRHPETVQPAQDHKTLVIPPARHREAIQLQQEHTAVVPQPVVKREAVVSPTRESRSPQSERVHGVMQPSVGRPEKTAITPKVQPSQPVAERKDKEGNDQNQNKENSR
ncbi:MAG: hypothetical protein WCP12_08150 [bacterium]